MHRPRDANDPKFEQRRKAGGKIAAWDEEIKRSIPVSGATENKVGSCVFLVADSVYLFQAISAPKRARGNDSRSHSRPNTRNHFQFLFRRRVDVDLAEIDFVFCARLLRFNPIHSGIRMDQWRRGRYSGERVRERQGLESSILFDHEDTKERRLLGMYVHAPCPYAPASDFLLLRFMLEFLKFFYLNSRVF